VQSNNASVNAEPSTSAVAADEEDSWNEDDDTQVERAGVFDTLFTSADFVEHSERGAVYGHIDSGRSDSVYSLLQLREIFLDTYSEELAFPNIFWGNGRPESHPVKIY